MIAETLIKSIHRGRGWTGDGLVIDKERVSEHAEVLTPPNIVNDMLDMLKGIELEQTFLEPSCGTGNFLVEILRRKLALCETKEDIFKAVSTIYGVDIQKDNVLESRLRMLEIVEDKCPDAEFLSVIAGILEKNIIGGDFILDKYGCEIEGAWVKGYVSNKTGTVEEDSISRSHDRLVAYTWKWNNGEPSGVVDFLCENNCDEITKVEEKSQEDLMAGFASMFQ